MTDNDNYIYELEQALTRLLDFFEPDTGGSEYTYTLWDDDEPLARIDGDLANAVDHANEILYGDSINDD